MPAPGANNPFAPGGGAGGIPRPVRMPLPGGAAASPAAGGATPAFTGGATANTGDVSLPGFGTATPAVAQSQQNTGPQLTKEETALILAAQKQRYQNAGNPIANLFPPSPGGQGQTPASSENNSGTTTPTTPTRVRPGWTPRTIPGLPPMPQ